MVSVNTVAPDDRRMSLRVAFIGGGSGGHLFPAIAVAQELLQEDPACRFLFLTSHRSVDHKTLATSGFSIIEAHVKPYAVMSSSRGVLNSVLMLPSLWRSLRLARKTLKAFQPDVVVGLGALASVPGVVAASRLGLPVVLWEQNSLPGKATRILARRAKLTVFGLRIEGELLRNWPSPTQICGVPVRAGIRQLAQIPVEEITSRRRILILGGSQGAHSVNGLVAEAIRNGMQIPTGWEIVHQTGESQVADIRHLYRQHRIAARVAAFLPDMQAEMSSACIAISRAGAVTIQELACAGLPTVFIPLSTAADNHQMFNALLLEYAQAAILISETDIDAVNRFRSACELLFADPEQRQKMGQAIRQFATPNASADIAGLLRAVAKVR